ncbi:MAG: sigma-70 family RNA polymerase sigma factor [Ferruginibacter sp.]
MGINNNERDASLWNQFKNGDEESFSAVFKNYYPDLFNYGCRITGNHVLVEDSIQELFLDIWRTKGKADILSLKAYIFKAFKFILIRMMAKNNKAELFIPVATENNFELSHENFIVNREQDAATKEKLEAAIQELSPRQKEIIYLKFYLNLNYEEVSDVMQINYQASRNLIYQAIKMLKKIISFYLFYLFVLQDI